LPGQALEPRLGILDGLAVLPQHELLGRVLEALLTEPSHVRLRPRGAAGEDPPVAEQEGLEVLAFGAQVLHRRLAGAHELAHRLGSGTQMRVSSPARCRRAKVMASRRLVLTRSPGRFGIREGAITAQSWPSATTCRCGPYPIGPAS
jgi:hypothetical protein